MNNISDILNLLRVFQEIAPDLPLQYAICLLEISNNEGFSISDLSKKTGISLPTTSRIVSALSDHRPNGSPYELIDKKRSTNKGRVKELYLSHKGQFIMNKLAQKSRFLQHNT